MDTKFHKGSIGYFTLNDNLYIVYDRFMIVNGKVYELVTDSDSSKICHNCEADSECSDLMRSNLKVRNPNKDNYYVAYILCSVPNNFIVDTNKNLKLTNRFSLIHFSYIRANLPRLGWRLELR